MKFSVGSKSQNLVAEGMGEGAWQNGGGRGIGWGRQEGEEQVSQGGRNWQKLRKILQ